MNRTAKANAKRAAQQARRDERAAGIRGESPLDEVVMPGEAPADEPDLSPDSTPAD